MPLRASERIAIVPQDFPAAAVAETAAAAAPAPLTSKILAVPNIDQRRDAWCYAACAVMVLRFYGSAVSQCKIVKFIHNAECCASPALGACNNNGCKPEEVARIFKEFGIQVNDEFEASIKFSAVKAEINAEQPIEVGLVWDTENFSGHAVIIHGYFGDGFLNILDPLPEGGNGGINHISWLRSAFGNGKWSFTWTGLRKE